MYGNSQFPLKSSENTIWIFHEQQDCYAENWVQFSTVACSILSSFSNLSIFWNASYPSVATPIVIPTHSWVFQDDGNLLFNSYVLSILTFKVRRFKILQKCTNLNTFWKLHDLKWEAKPRKNPFFSPILPTYISTIFATFQHFSNIQGCGTDHGFKFFLKNFALPLISMFKAA